MAIQALPTEFTEIVRKACQDQGVEYDETIEAISQTIIGDVLAYIVWQGPGPQIPQLLIALLILTPRGLFNYAAYQSGNSASGCIFFDAISQTLVVNSDDPSANHVLAILKHDERDPMRIFSDDAGLPKLLAFHRMLIQTRDEYYLHSNTQDQLRG